jgi:hypothetical protein
MMKKVLVAALLTLASVSPSLSPQAAKADTVIYCNSGADNGVSRNATDHPRAYTDGYQAGEQSFRNGQAYKPQDAEGEFARGFEDGYFNRPYTGQEVIASNGQGCSEANRYTVVAPPPTVVYSYPYVVAPPPVFYEPYPFVNFGINFSFGRGHYGWGYRRW